MGKITYSTAQSWEHRRPMKNTLNTTAKDKFQSTHLISITFDSSILSQSTVGWVENSELWGTEHFRWYRILGLKILGVSTTQQCFLKGLWTETGFQQFSPPPCMCTPISQGFSDVKVQFADSGVGWHGGMREALALKSRLHQVGLMWCPFSLFQQKLAQCFGPCPKYKQSVVDIYVYMVVSPWGEEIPAMPYLFTPPGKAKARSQGTKEKQEGLSPKLAWCEDKSCDGWGDRGRKKRGRHGLF